MVQKSYEIVPYVMGKKNSNGEDYDSVKDLLVLIVRKDHLPTF